MNSSVASSTSAGSLAPWFDPRSNSQKIPKSYDSGVREWTNTGSDFDSFFNLAHFSDDPEAHAVRDDAPAAEDFRTNSVTADSFRLPAWSRPQVDAQRDTDVDHSSKTHLQQPRNSEIRREPAATDVDVKGKSEATPQASTKTAEQDHAGPLPSEDAVESDHPQSQARGRETKNSEVKATEARSSEAKPSDAASGKDRSNDSLQVKVASAEGHDAIKNPSDKKGSRLKTQQENARPEENEVGTSTQEQSAADLERQSPEVRLQASAAQIATALINAALSSTPMNSGSPRSETPVGLSAGGTSATLSTTPGATSATKDTVATDVRTITDAPPLRVGDAAISSKASLRASAASLLSGRIKQPGVEKAALRSSVGAVTTLTTHALRGSALSNTTSQSGDAQNQIPAIDPSGEAAKILKAFATTGSTSPVVQETTPTDDAKELEKAIAGAIELTPNDKDPGKPAEASSQASSAQTAGSQAGSEPALPVIKLGDGYRLSVVVSNEVLSRGERSVTAVQPTPAAPARGVRVTSAADMKPETEARTAATSVPARAERNDIVRATAVDAFVLELSSAKHETAKGPVTPAAGVVSLPAAPSSTSSSAKPAAQDVPVSSPLPTTAKVNPDTTASPIQRPAPMVMPLRATMAHVSADAGSDGQGRSSGSSNDPSSNMGNREDAQSGSQHRESASSPQLSSQGPGESRPTESLDVRTASADQPSTQVQGSIDETAALQIPVAGVNVQASAKVADSDRLSKVSTEHELPPQTWTFSSNASAGITPAEAALNGTAGSPANLDLNKANSAPGHSTASPQAGNADDNASRLTASRLVDQIAEPAGRAQTANKSLTLRIDGPDQSSVDVRVTGRPGQIRVAVRTGDADLSTALRQDLGTLVDSLARSGYHAQAGAKDQAGSLHSAASGNSGTDGAGRDLAALSSTGQSDTGDHHGREGSRDGSNGQGQHSGGQGSHSDGSGRRGEGSGSGSNSSFSGSPQQQRRQQMMARWLASMQAQSPGYAPDNARQDDSA